ncbi:UNVERIFIED_CONTAM: hypothetical protein RMT77_007329 [Armadillidium vulgare]|nr:Vacuolar protein-sorting-associated protein 36 [Armadillidium vulgare]
MDRWYWSQSCTESGECVHQKIGGVRLYDGDQKTSFKDGILYLTDRRIIWEQPDKTVFLALNLSLVILVEEEKGGFRSDPKIILHLATPTKSQSSGPIGRSNFTFIKLSFSNGGKDLFEKNLEKALQAKAWEKSLFTQPQGQSLSTMPLRAGILGIERDIHSKQRETSSNISKAFEDLKNLMSLAKDMVTLSRNIANKIKEQTGEISSDETVQLRSYLLSLGVDDPVTKEAVGSTTEYHKKLAQEICNVLKSSVEEVGGVMLLSEVYCRINRARGLQLLSPEDVYNACSLMSNMHLPLRLFTFKSGVQVLQLSSLDEEEVSNNLKEFLEGCKEGGISPIEFSRSSGVPLLLAQERLYHAERCGVTVRDESSEGLRFYPNLFFTRT